MKTETADVNIGPREGMLAIPEGAKGIVIFAHGSGSSRRSPRNLYVAKALQERGLATLLHDLLTEEEAADRANVFDIELLASRLNQTVQWAREDERTQQLAYGLFGASTGAGAALIAAAEPNAGVAAVVSRGGRPDLAGDALDRVRAPTLLIVGGLDAPVIGLNEKAYERLSCEKELQIVEGAGHVFDEPGTLEKAAELAGDWFGKYLGAPAAAA